MPTKKLKKLPSEVSVESKSVPPVKEPNEINSQDQTTHFPESKQASANRGALILGVALLLAGVVLITGQFLHVSLGHYFWPFIFIIPGILIFFIAINDRTGARGEGIAILGGILTTLGLLFLVQSVTGTWASWAYAWSLIAPTSVGISQIIYGSIKKDDGMVSTGKRITRMGLIIFVIGFIFFELVIGLNGFGLERFGLPTIPVVLIVFGVLILIREIFFRR